MFDVGFLRTRLLYPRMLVLSTQHQLLAERDAYITSQLPLEYHPIGKAIHEPPQPVQAWAFVFTTQAVAQIHNLSININRIRLNKGTWETINQPNTVTSTSFKNF